MISAQLDFNDFDIIKLYYRMLNRQWKLTPRFLSHSRATANIVIRSKIDNMQGEFYF